MPFFEPPVGFTPPTRLWLLILLISLAFSAHTYAQTDTTKVALNDQAAIKEAQLDSATNRLNSLLANKEAKLDSLQNDVDDVLSSTDKWSNKINHLTDTLQPDVSIQTRALDSLKNKLTLQIDSLNRLGRPVEKYKRKLDSLQQTGPFMQINKAENKISGLQQKVAEPGNKVGQAVNEKLALMNKEGGSEANLPGQVNIPGIGNQNANIPGVPGATIPGGGNGGIDDPLGNINMPSTEVGGLGGVSDPLKDVGPLPQTELGNFTNIEGFDKMQQSIGQVGNITKEITSYGDEVKNIKEDGVGKMEDVPKALEGKVAELEQVQGLQNEMGGVDEMKGIIDKGQDPEAMKKMLASEAKEKAIDYFSAQGEQLKSAMQKVSSLKQKYSSLSSIKDIQKHPPNPMKGKSLRERLVPGLVLQFQVSEHMLIDFNPVLGYRIGGKVNAGAGWNYRWSVGKDFKTFNEERVYGPRIYAEWKFGKGFALRTDIEKMNTVVPPIGFPGTANEGPREWVWSVFIGLKKEYQFMKKVKGNFQFLYNLYDDHDNSPYADRLVVRTGFEFPQKKRVKKKIEK